MTNFTKLLNMPEYDLYTELNNLISNNIIKWPQSNQICLNTTALDNSNYLLGTGSLIYDWDNAVSIIDDNGNETVKVEKYKTSYQETDFTVLCSQFVGTLFEEVYNALSKQYKLGRVRLMRSKSKTCLSWHTDSSVRIHYPIKTQEGCFMIIGDEVKHLSLNQWWLTNTLLYHTAMNASNEDRIHLVAAILGEK
jgi:hypothetical protein